VARMLGDMIEDVANVGHDDLTALPGIGQGTADRIVEFIETGRIEEHQKLLTKIPVGLLKLLAIPGLGPKTVALLWKQAGVESEDDLRRNLTGDELASLPGMGKKKLENLRKNLAFAQRAAARVGIGTAMPQAKWFVQQLDRLKQVKQAAYAGSLRRGRETIGDIDLLVAAEAKHSISISNAFVKLEPVAEVQAKGTTKTSIRTTDGLQVDLRIVGPDQFGAALMYFTGSKQHNVVLRERAIRQGMKLNEYGLFQNDKSVAGKTEQQVYDALGLSWVPPELREDRGEIVLAENDFRHKAGAGIAGLPKLIALADIQSELHAHTTASDGKWSIRELASAAAERGFHTVAVTDHSKGQAQANGLNEQRLEKHIEDIHAVAAQMKGTITVLAGSEVDILANGKLDYPNSLLKQLDIVVASPHSALSQDTAKATARLLKAIQNPYVTMVAHPTGRLINRREGLSPDMKRVIAAAAERGIALEINANSWRLDLRDSHARAAIEAGVKLSINTDAHGPGDLDQLIYGVLTARRAGATKKDVINCMSRVALTKWMDSTRS
ncbi:MAG: DNA polymerase/3'-5' exonuclease PolX, partial [Phycisphaeraceae bacterium]